MVYDTSNTFVNNIGRKVSQVKRYSIIHSCFVYIKPLNHFLYIFSEVWGKSKHKEFGKILFMVTTIAWFL